MAQVPYDQGVPFVSPDPRPPEDYQHVEAQPSEFGGLLAQGEEKLGQGATTAVKFYSQIAAQQAVGNWQLQANQALGDYQKLKGQDAMSARPDVLQGLTDAEKEGSGSLPTAEAQLNFTKSIRYLRARYEAEIGSHYDQQAQVWGVGVNETDASLGQQAIEAGAVKGNAAQIQDGASRLANARIAQAHLLYGDNLTPDMLQGVRNKAAAEGIQIQVQALVPTDPSRAARILDANKDRLPANVYDALSQRTKAYADAGTMVGNVNAFLGSPPPESASGPPPAGVHAAIVQQSAAVGVPTDVALTIAQAESGIGTVPDKPGNPHSGVFQMGPAEWSAAGGTPADRNDPIAQAQRGTALVAQDMTAASAALGRPAQGWEAYVVHGQGFAGGAALLKASPDANAVDTLAPSAGGIDAATAQIKGNGGTSDMTVGQFLATYQTRYVRAATQIGTVPAPASQGADRIARQFAAIVQQSPGVIAHDPEGVDRIARQFAAIVQQSPGAAPPTALPGVIAHDPEGAAPPTALPGVIAHDPEGAAPPTALPGVIAHDPEGVDRIARQYLAAPAEAERLYPADAVKQRQFVEMVRSNLNEVMMLQNRDEAERQKARADASTAAMGSAITGITTDPTKFDPRTLNARDASGNYVLAPEQRENLTEFYNKQLTEHGVENTAPYGPGYSQAYNDIISSSSAAGHINSLNDIIYRGRPGGDLSGAGVSKLAQIFAASRRSPDEREVVSTAGGMMAEAKRQLLFPNAVDSSIAEPFALRDPRGEAIYNTQFLPRFNKGLSDAEASGDPQKVWDFLSKDNLEKVLAPMKRTPQQLAHDLLVQTGGSVPNAAPHADTTPIPPAPKGLNDGQWSGIMTLPPRAANGQPWTHQEWAHALGMLVANPTPQGIKQFDDFFGPQGYDGAELVQRLTRKSEPSPEPLLSPVMSP